jgi:hypothetical protein
MARRTERVFRGKRTRSDVPQVWRIGPLTVQGSEEAAVQAMMTAKETLRPAVVAAVAGHSVTLTPTCAS